MIIKGKKLEAYIGTRIDKLLLSFIEGQSRSEIQKLLKSGKVTVNDLNVKTGYLCKADDVIKVDLQPKVKAEILKQDLALKILFENDDYMVVFKPSGILTHLDNNYRENTLVNGLVDKIKLDDFENLDRPGIVHRLDKETSGLVLVCKNINSYNFYVSEFKNRKVEKKYYALVFGILKHKEGIIDSPISRDVKSRKKMSISTDKKAKVAITEYKVIEEYVLDNVKMSLLDINLKTGRTHQIRVHLSAIGHSVVGDYLYGHKKDNLLIKVSLKRTFLEAYNLCFRDFSTLEKKCFLIPLSEDLNLFLDRLG